MQVKLKDPGGLDTVGRQEEHRGQGQGQGHLDTVGWQEERFGLLR